MTENQTALREAANSAVIEGVLAELRLEVRDINEKEAITGEIDVKTGEDSIHTLRVFAYRYNKEGKESGIYKGLKTVMDEYKSIASHGVDEADKVRITQGKIGLNEYYVQDELKSFPQLSTNFINRLKPTDEFNPRAQFELEMYVHSVVDEIKNEEETGRAILKGYVPLYGGKVIPFSLIVADAAAVDYVKNNYETGSTVTVYGDIVNSIKIKRIEIEVGFGKPQEKITSTTVREYVVTGGSVPMDEDDPKAYKQEAIRKALTEREIYLNELKNKNKDDKQKNNTKKGFDTKTTAKPNNSKTINVDDLPF